MASPAGIRPLPSQSLGRGEAPRAPPLEHDREASILTWERFLLIVGIDELQAAFVFVYRESWVQR
jgi:hypothetical protein